MPDPKGQKLFVNLGPSQVRRRLKGFGHGVRKVQSAGRNRAAIIHTATGQHLTELEAKFADVGFSADEHDLSQPIENLPHLGPVRALWLRAAGITTIADLERLGHLAAYHRIRLQQPAAGATLLWVLAAGLQGRDWRELTDEEKDALLRETEGKAGG